MESVPQANKYRYRGSYSMGVLLSVLSVQFDKRVFFLKKTRLKNNLLCDNLTNLLVHTHKCPLARHAFDFTTTPQHSTAIRTELAL